MPNLSRCALVAGVALGAATAAVPARADAIVGGSSLITLSDVGTIRGWLGMSDLTLTRIFSKTAGDGKTAADFHAAADGVANTISIMAIAGGDTIGGYNPYAWTSVSGYGIGAQRGIIFDLTTGYLQNQVGTFTSANDATRGPNFGAGNDIAVLQDLETGYFYPFDYASDSTRRNVLGQPLPSGQTDVTYSGLEVFVIGAIPAPGAAALGLVGVGVIARRRRR